MIGKVLSGELSCTQIGLVMKSRNIRVHEEIRKKIPELLPKKHWTSAENTRSYKRDCADIVSLLSTVSLPSLSTY